MKKLILLTTLLLPFIMFSQVQLGVDINGEYDVDRSGHSVSSSSDGTIVAIGAPSNRGSGHVRVYSWNGTAWTQLGADIDADGWNPDGLLSSIDDYLGTSVSLSSDGNILAIGANGNDGNGSNSGHVRVYSWNGTAQDEYDADGNLIANAWTQLGADIDGEASSDESGWLCFFK